MVIQILNNNFILDSFRWSFSSINAYKQCPAMFYKQYIECLKRTNNAFAEWGSFFHDLFEKYYKKELEFFELSLIYENEYSNNVRLKFPPNAYVNLNENYYKKGKEYLDNFEGDFEDCEILGIEQEIHLNIDGYNFIGYIDLVLKDDKGIFIVDHKSKSKFKSKKEKKEYLRQLYLYSIYIHEKYGVYPYRLIFNMFKVNEKIDVNFDYKEYEDAKKWFIETIKDIYNDIEFKTQSDDFFCNWLCSVNSFCKCSDKYIND